MDYKLEIELSKTNTEVLKINNLYVHSKYDPVKEAQRIVDEQFKSHHLHIIFGYGLGYVVDAVLQKRTDEAVIIVDPLLENGQLQVQEKHKNQEKLMIWSPSSTSPIAYFMNKLAGELDTKVAMLATANYTKLFLEDYVNLAETVRNAQKKAQIDKITRLFFSDKWQENLTDNVPYIVNDHSLMVLENKLKAPVVVASGGPSLTKQLPLLKKYERHIIIIAAGSTINSLLAANIEPDFVVSIDGGEPNYHHFKNIQVKNTRLIYSVFNHAGIRPLFKKQGYMFAAFKDQILQKYFTEKFDKSLPLVLGGGTVAQYGYSVAHILNAGPIAFIGQDLAFTNNETHAKNNKYFEKLEESKWKDAELIEAEGYYGDTVLTSHVFYSMKTTFEDMVKFHQAEQLTFNCTEGGIKINGMNQLPFKDFITKFVKQDIVKDFTEIDAMTTKGLTNSQIISKLSEELETLKNLNLKTVEALRLLKSNKSKIDFPLKTLKKLDKIDRYIEKYSKDVQIHYLITPIKYEVDAMFLEADNETPQERYQRVSNQSMALYKRLGTAFDKAIVNSKTLIESLKENDNDE